MTCPQDKKQLFPWVCVPAAQLPAIDGSLVFAVLKAFAESPGRIER